MHIHRTNRKIIIVLLLFLGIVTVAVLKICGKPQTKLDNQIIENTAVKNRKQDVRNETGTEVEAASLPASKANHPGSDSNQDGKMWNRIMENKAKYPDEVMKMATVNSETWQFVLDYPEKRGVVTADNIGPVEAGKIPLLIQWDERWGYGIYGDSVVGAAGCGPTSLAMVAAGLTGDNHITPYDVAKYADDAGYNTESGTDWTMMTQGCMNFGIAGQDIRLSEASVYAELTNGNPIICSVGPGDFTDTGHFIVLSEIIDGKIRVLDPNSNKNSEKLWDYQTISKQVKNLWAYSRM